MRYIECSATSFFNERARAYDRAYDLAGSDGFALRARMKAVLDLAGPGPGEALDAGMGPGRLLGELAARGWTRDGGDLFEVLERLNKAGCARYVVTDILKDGMMRGPNLDLLRDVCAHTDAPVIASGGVSTLDDLRALATLEPLGVEGVITGKALYAGAFTVADALATLRSPSP